MLDSDVPVWERWTQAHGDPSWTYRYDVRVGQGITPDPRLSQVMSKWAIDITKKRIDCVVHKPGEILIIEVKTRAGLNSIAQVVSYPLLYQAQYNPTLPLRPILIAEKLLLDVEMLLRLLDVTYYVLPPDNPTSHNPTTPRSPIS